MPSDQHPGPDYGPSKVREMYPRWRFKPDPLPGPVAPCMDDLFELAERDAFVRSYLAQWRAGNVTLEQALVGIACELAARCERLSAEALNAAGRSENQFGGLRWGAAPNADEPVPHVAEGGG